jgi:hypothetical protein
LSDDLSRAAVHIPAWKEPPLMDHLATTLDAIKDLLRPDNGRDT